MFELRLKVVPGLDICKELNRLADLEDIVADNALFGGK